MELLVYAVVGLTLTWALYAGYMHIATRAAEGRSARVLFPAIPGLATRSGRSLVYCFSPHCRPCRPMAREVDKLVAEGLPVFKLDIMANPEISRALGIRATPTLIVVEDGRISRMLLGVRTAPQMTALLAP